MNMRLPLQSTETTKAAIEFQLTVEDELTCSHRLPTWPAPIHAIRPQQPNLPPHWTRV